MDNEVILAFGIFVFGIFMVGTYVFFRIKFNQWGEPD